jgi:hypothetical protein
MGAGTTADPSGVLRLIPLPLLFVTFRACWGLLLYARPVVGGLCTRCVSGLLSLPV